MRPHLQRRVGGEKEVEKPRMTAEVELITTVTQLRKDTPDQRWVLRDRLSLDPA